MTCVADSQQINDEFVGIYWRVPHSLPAIIKTPKIAAVEVILRFIVERCPVIDMKVHLKYARDVLKSPAQEHKWVFWGSSSGSMNLKLLR